MSQASSDRGKIYAWRYTENERNYPGWHLTADREGCHAGLKMCRDMLAGDERHGVLRLLPPTKLVLSVPNNRGGRARFVAPKELHFNNLAGSGQTPSIDFEPISGRLTVACDVAALSALSRGFQDILDGEGDYAIRIGKDKIWVWWHV